MVTRDDDDDEVWLCRYGSTIFPAAVDSKQAQTPHLVPHAVDGMVVRLSTPWWNAVLPQAAERLQALQEEKD